MTERRDGAATNRRFTARALRTLRDMPFTVDLNRAVRVIAWVAVAVVAVSLANLLLNELAGVPILRKLNVEYELSIPAWFSASMLLLGGLGWVAIAAVRRRAGDPDARRWMLLALCLLAASIDEAAVIHEQAIDPLRDALDTGGVLYNAWVLPGVVLVGFLAALLLPALLRLPRHVRTQLLVAATVFVAGAVGMELLGGVFADEGARAAGNAEGVTGATGLVYRLIVHVEEGLEMAGAVILLRVTSRFLSEIAPEVRLAAAPDRHHGVQDLPACDERSLPMTFGDDASVAVTAPLERPLR